MSKRGTNSAYDNYAPIGWRTGRSSVEGTPTTSRKVLLSNGSKEQQLKSPPAVKNLMLAGAAAAPLSGHPTTSADKTSSSSATTPLSGRKQPVSSQNSQNMSISELVDSGLNTLGHSHSASTNKVQERKNGAASSSSKSMSPLQAYILEQAKLSGYDVDDRDSYVESDLDSR